MLERKRANLLRQVGGVRTHHRTEGTATAAELRHAGRAVTGTAGALLLVHLLAGAPDLGAALGLVGAGLALVELPLHAASDDVGARLEAEDRIRQRDRARVLALESRDFQFHGQAPCSAGAAAAASSATLNLPGFGASFGSGFFTASRTLIQPPLEPGTAPSTRIRPRSTSVCTTRRLSVVMRSTPMWQGIFFFSQVLRGSERPRVEPIERCEIDTPWVARRPPKFQRFMPPANPLPTEVPVTSTNWPTTKWAAWF